AQLQVPRGVICALVGMNGAGKSTLMKILSGVYNDYEGKILLRGEVVNFSNPREAQGKGIAIIHQELTLIPYLTITENIFLGRELETAWGELDKKAMKQRTLELLQKLKMQVDPNTQVLHLKVGQQQVVEMAKALLTDSDVIIMDEPTSAISDTEVNVLFDIIKVLREEGKAIIYISHKLDELFRIADAYIVLRDGKMIECGSMDGMQTDDIIHKMVGREINLLHKTNGCELEEELLSVKNICLKHPERKDENFLKNISFSLKKGEILGLFGLMGAGRTELLETLFGQYPKLAEGEICVSGDCINIRSAADATKYGIALVPEDRKKDGLVLGMDVEKNIGLTTLKDMETAGFIDAGKEESLSDKYIRDLKIKTSSSRQDAGSLSGGNQQKIVIAKWLATHPKVLLLDEPTRGIDVNAKNEIYKLIVELADKGMGIIMVSSELPEILAISDRVLVMAEGRITACFPIAEASEAVILKAAIPTTI
ncbi:MAG: sugar ABC transporter ATP-binding protein, partial [Pedobacter sp.]